MFYLVKNLEDIPPNVHKDKESKLKLICQSVRDDVFLSLLYGIYPEGKRYEYSNYILGSSIVNRKYIGLSLQLAITIIENPYIFGIYRYDVIDTSLHTHLYTSINSFTDIIHLDYNGNYCKIIAKCNNAFIFERILLSKTTHEFIPSHPEFVYNSNNKGHSYFTYDSDTPQYMLLGHTVLFINDYHLSEYINKDHAKPNTMYIFVNSLEHYQHIQFLAREHYNFILLVRIRLIKDYKKLKSLLESINVLSIFINSANGSDELLNQINSFDIFNLFVDSTLNVNTSFRTLDFRSYGLINESSFTEFRKRNGLPVMVEDHTFLNFYEIH